MKKRRIVLLVILIILLVLLIAAGIFAYKNRNTISALYYTFTGQSEQVEIDKLDTDKRAEEAIQEYGIESIRPLNEEESQKLNSGELTEEEAIKIVLGQKDENADVEKLPAKDNTNTGSAGTVDNTAEPEDDKADEELKKKNEEIAGLIGKMYVLKSKFTGELEGIEGWVTTQYRECVKQYGEGKIPTSEKIKIGREAYSKALALESQCDSQVADILNRLTALLSETNQSTDLVSEIQAAYENEKKVAKSLYMSKI